MKATIVVDNIPSGGLKGEWGLCIYIEYEGRKLLLDAGNSDLFAENLKKMDIPIEEIEYAFLSHAHSDHSRGFPRFFAENQRAQLYLQECCKENCYFKLGFLSVYEGIPKGMLTKNANRIVRVKGKTEILDGLYVLPHKPSNESLGKYQHMYVRKDGKLTADDFSHEQSLVFRTGRGLAVFNSCSHTGADAIIEEVKEAFPGEPVFAYLGGLHLAGQPTAYMRRIAAGIRESGIERVYTGHCTKEKGFSVLKEELGDMLTQFKVGMEIEI